MSRNCYVCQVCSSVCALTSSLPCLAQLFFVLSLFVFKNTRNNCLLGASAPTLPRLSPCPGPLDQRPASDAAPWRARLTLPLHGASDPIRSVEIGHVGWAWSGMRTRVFDHFLNLQICDRRSVGELLCAENARSLCVWTNLSFRIISSMSDTTRTSLWMLKIPCSYFVFDGLQRIAQSV